MPKYIPGIMRQRRFIPWIYLFPALFVMTTFIVYPAFNTLYLSLRNSRNTDWAGGACTFGENCWGVFENFRYALTSSVMQTAFLNNIKWIFLMVSGTVAMGLLIAVLADRVKYEPIAKAIIFMPMAISFVGAGVIWKFMYNFNAGEIQIGLLNAIILAFGGKPISFLTETRINTIALIIVGIWMWTGFCMTILAAALKNVSVEILEAARVDGANEWQVFRKIMVPQILPTITVVVTTMIINVLKIFDIVYVMTGGNYGTDVIANRMYTEMYTNYNPGRASAIAVVLIAVIVPVMIFNIRRFREQEETR